MILGDLAEAVTQRLGGSWHRATVYENLDLLVESVQAGAPLPEAVLAGCVLDRQTPASSAEKQTGTSELADRSHALSQRALATMQAWIAEERLSNSRLVFVTMRAVAVEDGEDVRSLEQAPLWGLVRAAQSELRAGSC